MIESNFANKYIDFITYCNPNAPADMDYTPLIRSFNSVPKSDGKNFDTWTLYQLVSKHHSGEIKTWTKLAQQLGVERTADSSPQKIQQYAVRLKKWMKSIHIDAFFDYLLARPNEYYQDPDKNPILIRRSGSSRNSKNNKDGHRNKRLKPSVVSKSSRSFEGNLRRRSVVQHATNRGKGTQLLGKPKNISISQHIPTPNPSPTNINNFGESGSLHHRLNSSTTNNTTTGGVSEENIVVVVVTFWFWQQSSNNNNPNPESSETTTTTTAAANNSAAGSNDTTTAITSSSSSFAELLFPPNDPNETISVFQKRLVKAVGMLEDKERQIDMLKDLIRQRDEEMRSRIVKGMKNDIMDLFQKWEQ
ncbi:12628_t:CDS:2 [Entrophospora sp. SA101]|nr:12628_t:CDS:2 [Entrophospora sp. SA101]